MMVTDGIPVKSTGKNRLSFAHESTRLLQKVVNFPRLELLRQRVKGSQGLEKYREK